MFRVTFLIWLRAVALVLVLAISLMIQTSSANLLYAAASSPTATESFMVTDGMVSAVSGQTAAGAYEVGDPRLATAGPMIFADLKDIEGEVRALLQKNKTFRQDISPHRGENNFDDLVRQFDIEAGFTTAYSGAVTLGDMIDDADAELRQARDLYAYLAVYANETRFQDDDNVDCGDAMDDPFADPPTINWCNFAARMRESLREAAYVRMIFGQQFTADALGFTFGANIVGGDDFVHDEVNKLEMAEEQFLLAREAVAEGLDHDLGNGCYIYDFYSDAEWALLSRAVEGLERARHHMAVRKSYLAPDSDSWPTAKAEAQTIMQKAATDQYVDLALLAGLVSDQSPCARGTRPDNDLVAEMAANLLMTQESAREMGAGRNIFGFDVSFTPARPYRTAPSSEDRGLWEEAERHALRAQAVQDIGTNAERAFDLENTKLLAALRDVKEKYDIRLGDYTGCSTGLPDDAFFACVDAVADGLRACNPVESEADYLMCINPYGGQLREEWDHLREAALEIKRTQQELTNLADRQVIEMERNTTVTSEILTNGAEQAALEFLATLLDSFSVSAEFGFPDFGVSISNNPLQPVIAAARSTQTLRQAVSDMRIENANSEAAVRNLLLDAVELQRQLEIDAHKAQAQLTVFENLASGTVDLAVEARRARAYVAQSPANDPSFRLVRDSIRLQLADDLELATRTSYLAAKRAEYEYATRLSASNAPISTIYQARTAQDVLGYLGELEHVTNNLIISGSEIHRKEFTLSMAQHVLGWTDDALGLTGDAAREERIRLFRAWVAEHTVTGGNGDPELYFHITTSPADNGVFSTAIAQVYDRYWLHKVTGDGLPDDDNVGLAMNLITPEAGLGYRDVVVKQAGVVHLKTRSGCVFNYRLVHPAALLGLEWPEGQATDVASASFEAAINGQNGGNTGAFLGRPVSATDWVVIVKAGAPGDPGLPDMDLQQLEDIELIFDSTHGDRDPGVPQARDCVRVDY